MNYIVYHISSTQKLKSFGSETSARRSTTCANRNKVVSKKKVKNLLTGKEIEIDSNTPLCCDPSSETYWSM
jgi:hypothetical protein